MLRAGKQTGVALVTAVLVAALAATIAIGLASRQQIDIRRAANVLDNDRAQLFTLGAEDWAAAVLRRDRKDGERDALGEDWARLLPPLLVEGAQLSGRIEDMQGRFNLNNLVQGDKPSPRDVRRFERLLEVLGVDRAFIPALIDWIDPDMEISAGGAEDEYYLALPQPYRSANRPLASASELRWVKGMDAERWHKLAPYVVALPGSTDININTAPATVLAALADGWSVRDGEAVAELRGKNGFTSLNEFIGHDMVKARAVDTAGLTLGSRYFMLSAEARYGHGRSEINTLLGRDDAGVVRVIMRSRGTY